MNILMALSQLEITGAEVYATTVGDKLISHGYNVYYVSDTLTRTHRGTFYKLHFNKRSILRRFWHVGYLLYLIKKNKIQLVHAHSRSSRWSCYFACKITGIAMVTSIHGRQSVHTSSKKVHAMGDKVLPVCEEVYKQLIHDFKVPTDIISINRNGVRTEDFFWHAAPTNDKPVISIIGRLTGPKGELCYKLLDECLDFDKYYVQVISASKIDPSFDKFSSQVNFFGHSQNITEILTQSDLVIGAGRVAMESLLCGRPTFAIGEAGAIGIINQNNISQAIATNFGDTGSKELDIDFLKIKSEVEKGLKNKYCSKQVTNIVRQNYDLNKIVDQLENIYQTTYVEKFLKKIPIIMYHRFIQNDSEKGVHGTYLHVEMLEKHFKLLKRMKFETLTFEDLANKEKIFRLELKKRYIIITADDGYEDNYYLLLPLLKKYNFKAVVYAVTKENFNRWDVEVKTNPDILIPLMTLEQIKTISDSGHVEIGGHTLTHPRLNTLTFEEQKMEIEKNKIYLEKLLGRKLISFAYPYGEYNQDSKDIAKKVGYQYAVATNGKQLDTHSDLYQISRIAIFPRTSVFGLWRKIFCTRFLKK
ncbi:polysaccharide deacetylase [Candidatus Photodesmus blepharus]|uniref:Polysaccharide deacetylase n=1 Tax=Candidatus Photodesmus blepharonis TaxID=1179155 RepID=A0A084CME4_9GAMM|nr:polysaccharide deacetylase family protein [Candidatus Photodesmus blepharus]KEY90973.1 polysaccharide deacetylase [Candidatus Photodesmus blepharus]